MVFVFDDMIEIIIVVGGIAIVYQVIKGRIVRKRRQRLECANGMLVTVTRGGQANGGARPVTSMPIATATAVPVSEQRTGRDAPLVEGVVVSGTPVAGRPVAAH